MNRGNEFPKFPNFFSFDLMEENKCLFIHFFFFNLKIRIILEERNLTRDHFKGEEKSLKLRLRDTFLSHKFFEGIVDLNEIFNRNNSGGNICLTTRI